MPPAHGRRLAAAFPNSRLVEIADSYTLIPIDQPALLAEHIREFIRSDLAADDVIAYCRERLAAYKYPREIRFVAELPKGPSGKILKSALRDG